MPRVIVIAVVLLTAHIAGARGITSKELIGIWIMGAAGADTVCGTFRSDLTYSITHGERPWAQGTWKLSKDGKSLEMINSNSRTGGVTKIRRFDGRLLHVTISNGEEGSWEKVGRARHSKHDPHGPNQVLEQTAARCASTF